MLAAAFNANINPNTLMKETSIPFVASGLVWSTISGLAAGMTSGVLYYNGIRTPVNSVSSETFTASKDTYIDVDVNANVTYNAVSNNASAPALTTNSIRVAKVVTGASSISSITQTGVDSNNVQIYQNSPDLPLSWLSWVPTVTASAGTITTVSGTGFYQKFGKTIVFRATLSITTNGTGSGSVTFTLPVISEVSTSNISIGSGREGSIGGKTLAVVLSTASAANVFNYDNSYPGSNGAVLNVSGIYETP